MSPTKYGRNSWVHVMLDTCDPIKLIPGGFNPRNLIRYLDRRAIKLKYRMLCLA
jgi:hypothetical protein